jgi:hypothetical protein
MRTTTKEMESLLETIRRPKSRSTLFWWLLDNYESVVEKAAAAGNHICWGELCGHFTSLGLTDQRGQPITPANAKRTWQRVRKEKVRADAQRAKAETEREAKAAARKVFPSHFRKEWRPEAASAHRSPAAPSAQLPTLIMEQPAKKKPWEEEGLTDEQREHVKSQYEAIYEDFAFKDQHSNPRRIVRK